MDLVPGLYELLIDNRLQDMLVQIPDGQRIADTIDPGERHDVLAVYLQHIIAGTLQSCIGPDAERQQLEILNRILRVLAEASGEAQPITFSGTHQLLELRESELTPPMSRPDTPLSRSCLLARTKLDPTLLSQLKKEILSADQIDIICSFIKWSGLRCLKDELQVFVQKPNHQLRVITTSYMGATDARAVEFLRELSNTEIRISYDRDRTRLHAKAFIFHRHTGFGTSYIGSANMSSAALTEGLEWNVKISQYESSHLWEKLTASYETHWYDGEFTPYQDGDQQKLEDALREAINNGTPDATLPVFDLRPFPFQQEILDRIAYERYAGRAKHLIVAATGTGKTMISAFDYRNFTAAVGGPYPRLLFIAHREEILKQSLATFRVVLRDMNFGNLFVGNTRSQQFDHIFMSIQSFHAGELWEHIPPDHFAYIVVDEFHHAEAPTYQRLLEHFHPQSLIGLTATPERADGGDVFRYFDWHTTAEIRLPDAINRKLLCPFHYFGITDTDTANLQNLRWQRGGYMKEDLDRIYTGNHIRAQYTIQKASELLLDIRLAKGLGFCVSVAHAHFMANQFNAVGIPAIALTGDSAQQERDTAQQRLRRGEINFIFTVDLYNEGIDIPEVDTVLFLRPTESLTVFLQQLGRGLRHAPGKECLTVLDFIGQAHMKYRFDVRYRALLDDPGRLILHQVEADFPHLPAGCLVKLERIAKDYVLQNIRQNLRSAKVRLLEAIAEDANQLGRVPDLPEFLERHQLAPDDLYRREVSWSRLCVEAEVRPAFHDPDEPRLTKGLRRIEHISGPRQISYLLNVLDLSIPLPTHEQLLEEEHRWLAMLHLSMWGPGETSENVIESLCCLRENPIMCIELQQLLTYQQGHLETSPHTLNLPFTCPLELHAAYTRDEILAGLGHWTLQYQPSMREGVLFLPKLNADLFMITLQKTDTDYSPTTMYEDYAISNNRFHWQSQSTTSEDSPTGRRYREHQQHEHNILLCVREYKSVNNQASPYYFLGPAEYISHIGSKPMSIIWHLQHPLPASLMRRTARADVG